MKQYIKDVKEKNEKEKFLKNKMMDKEKEKTKKTRFVTSMNGSSVKDIERELSKQLTKGIKTNKQ